MKQGKQIGGLGSLSVLWNSVIASFEVSWRKREW